MTNLDNYNTFVTGKRKVDTRRWKKIKEREKLVVYAERPESAHTAGSEPSGSGIPMILDVAVNRLTTAPFFVSRTTYLESVSDEFP
ncbi:hypothetical protein PI125_g14974 [Phytophthora idaei]|nr:hypothetical protein PI125_g14974 [Phytophthora idaei]KAG3163971.1 hypothetical protein PI126_g5290 [Phytophthora idaei]